MDEMKWYVVNTYSSYENRAKLALLERAKSRGMSDLIGEVLIPTEQVVEVSKGKRPERSRKYFPGYMLVQMHLTNESWHLVKDTPKVTGFIGGSTNPPPLPPHEVARITTQVEEGAREPVLIQAFSEGDSIKVTEGPFANFNGRVEQVDDEKKRLKVLVQIFGRDTPVELEFSQVEKT